MLEGGGSLAAMSEQIAALKARSDALVAAIGQRSTPQAGQGGQGRAASAGSDGAALLSLGATGAAATAASAAPRGTPAGQATRDSAGAALPVIAIAAEASRAGQALAAQQGFSCGVAVHGSTDAAHSARVAADHSRVLQRPRDSLAVQLHSSATNC